MGKRKLLYLYNATQTYTDTVFQHISALGRLSKYRAYFYHHDEFTTFNCDLSGFDAIGVHYSIRLPYDQLSPSGVSALKKFAGLKILFIQDEYDHTHRAWHWIKEIGFDLVFTVVPSANVGRVYPSDEFPGVTFLSVLTGYVPSLPTRRTNMLPPSERAIRIGYRGRSLPLRYGLLGKEKVNIGMMVKAYCDHRRISTDIAWTEDARIYGGKWFEFIGSCRAMLGSESGSNVFDWHGDLDERIAKFRIDSPGVSDEEIYQQLVAPLEMPGMMNQISPRVFETIAHRTALVLFEGGYSNVLKPWRHFIPVKKDGSNLPEVVAKLEDGEFLNAMTECAYREILESGQYSYNAFVRRVDAELEKAFEVKGRRKDQSELVARGVQLNRRITRAPLRGAGIRWYLAQAGGISEFGWRWASFLWGITPELLRGILRPAVKKLLGRA